MVLAGAAAKSVRSSMMVQRLKLSLATQHPCLEGQLSRVQDSSGSTSLQTGDDDIVGEPDLVLQPPPDMPEDMFGQRVIIIIIG